MAGEPLIDTIRACTGLDSSGALQQADLLADLPRAEYLRQIFGVADSLNQPQLTDKAVIDAIVSQYVASLEMLRSAILRMPDDLWDSPAFENRTWRIAYHTLWAARFYLAPSPEAFAPWPTAIEGAESLGGSWEPEGAAEVEGTHTAEELIRFLDSLLADIPAAVARLPLDTASGFDWYPFSRFELHLNSIRHIQHHAGQLIERMRIHGVRGINWVASKDLSGW